MIAALCRAYASFRGFDTAGTAVPAMDGPLTPNTRLDEAPVLARAPGIDNLCVTPSGLVGSQGSDILLFSHRDGAWQSRVLRRGDVPVSFLAAGPDGTLAVGLDGQGVLLLGGRYDGRMITQVAGTPIGAPTAAVFLDADTLIVANGSATFAAAEWKRDLMTRGASGSVCRLSLGDGSGRVLASDLAYPAGLALAADGTLFVSEAWRHRIVSLPAARPSVRVVELGMLPAYPGRILARKEGGFWVALFAPRNQLVEFVLTEEAYRRRMIETIDPDLWIAPALTSGVTFLEPIQGGARKKLNQLKPWSPSWSYGLVLRCDGRMRPIASYHSRADGQVHGVTSLAEQDGMLLVGAKGSGVIVGLSPDAAPARRKE